MRLSTHTVRAVCAALVLALPATALGKAPPPRRALDILPTLTIGQWIQLESVIQKDSQVLCTELRLLAGDFLDDDWSLRGRVEGIDVRARRFRIGSIPIQATDNALLEGVRGLLTGFSSLRVGMIVDVDGTYLKNGTFRAKEIEDESGETRAPRTDHRMAVVGRIERVDAGRHRIRVMGTNFLITDRTQLKSVIR